MTSAQLRQQTRQRLAKHRGRLRAGSTTKRVKGLRVFVTSIGLPETHAVHLSAFLHGAKPIPSLVHALGYQVDEERYSKRREQE